LKNSTLLQVKSNDTNELSGVEELKPILAVPKAYADLDFLKDEFFKRMYGKAENTLREYARAIDRLYAFMKREAIISFKDIKEEDIKAYKGELFKKGYSDVTVHYDMNALNRYCNFLIAFGLLDINPFRHAARISRPANTRKSRRYYSHHETTRRYNNFLATKYAQSIRVPYLKSLRVFLQYLESRSIKSVCSVSRETISEYIDHLWNHRDGNGAHYGIKTIAQRLQHLKIFFKFFYIEGIITFNPTKTLSVRNWMRDHTPDPRPKCISPVRKTSLFDGLFEEYMKYIKMKGYSPHTLRLYKKDLYIFFDWLGAKHIGKVSEVAKRVLQEYYKELHNYKGPDGKIWAHTTKYSNLVTIRRFFQFLLRHDYISTDPSATIELPKKERGLPTTCISDPDARKLLAVTKVSNSPFALRDKAILELLYSSAIRSTELCYLDVSDVDLENNYVKIRHAKGGKSFERVVPFGRLAHNAIKGYMLKLRPQLVKNDTPVLFLSCRGLRLCNSTMCRIVKDYAERAGIKTRVTTHSWRVGCATELLKNGVDIRYVQEQLGHHSLESTKQYVRLIPKDLKKMHNLYHPREKYYRSGGG